MAAFSANDLLAYFTQTNNSGIPCSAGDPCGSMDVELGTGSFSGDLVVTVQLSGPGQDFQFDRMGFNSDINSGLFLDCFNFESTCASGVGNASLGERNRKTASARSRTLCIPASMAAVAVRRTKTDKNLFTFVIGDSSGPLELSNINSYVAGHVANGACSGFIATTQN